MHTQRVLSAEGVLCAHIRYTHRRNECCEWRCGAGIVCTHTRYTHRRGELCVEVCTGCCVHTQRVLSAEGVLCAHMGGKSVVCGVGVVCTHKVHT